MTCTDEIETELKRFPFPTKFISNAYVGRTLCEEYCASHKRCWGCLSRCNNTCQWIALAECMKDKTLANSSDGTVSQKPSKYN